MSRQHSQAQAQARVVVIGAGTAGITAAIALRNQLNFDNFTIYERSPAIGGTWSKNTYPGCSCDVAIHWYSLSTELNPNWTSYYAEQPEILAYWERIFERHNLEKFTQFNTAVTSLEWSEPEQRYYIILKDIVTGVLHTTTAEVVISAVGFLQEPLIPSDITGIDSFRGPSWHSARWRHDVDLTGKRVGVIGNGCSGAQLIPQIAEDPTVEVINFARSRHWYVPKPQFEYSNRDKWVFGHVPFAARIYRDYIMARRDMKFMTFSSPDSFMSQLTRKHLTEYLKSKTPEHADELLPDFAPGCKRFIVDPGYLDSLKQPNVHLRWDKVESVVEEGLRLSNGEVVPLEVIIYATGFNIMSNEQVQITGRNGQTLAKYWNEHGGPTAYMGTCFPDIPNYFMINGPNTGTLSVIFSAEVQVQYVMQMIKPIIQANASSFTVKVQPTIKYNEWLSKRLESSVWNNCMSWYRRSKSNKNVITFPGPPSHYWWMLRRPIWEDFTAEGASQWKKELRRTKIAHRLLTLGITVVGFGLMSRSPKLKKVILEHLQRLVVPIASTRLFHLKI